MAQHQTSAYLSTRPLDDRPELFRTVKLNAVGWAGVAGLCAAGAAAGVAAGRRANAPAWLSGPAGAVAAFAGVLAADRRQWANLPTSYAWTDDLAEVRRVAALLQRAGVDAIADADGPALRFRNQDQRRVARVFRDAGLEPPRR